MATLPTRNVAEALGRFSLSKTPRELSYKAYIIAGEQGIIVEAWLPETVGLDVNAEYQAPYAQGIGQLNAGIGEAARFLGVSLTTQALTAQIWQGSGEFTFTLPLVFQAENSAASDVMLNIKRLLSLTMPSGNNGGLLRAPGPRLDLKKIGSALSAGADSAKQGFSDVAATGSNALSSFKAAQGYMKSAESALIGGAATAEATADAAARSVSSALRAAVVNNISLYLGQFIYIPSVVITDVSPTFDVVLAADKNPIRATVNVNFKAFFTPTKEDIDDMFPATAGLPLQNASDKTSGVRG